MRKAAARCVPPVSARRAPVPEPLPDLFSRFVFSFDDLLSIAFAVKQIFVPDKFALCYIIMTKSDCVNGKHRNFTESQKIVRNNVIATQKNRKKPVSQISSCPDHKFSINYTG